MAGGAGSLTGLTVLTVSLTLAIVLPAAAVAVATLALAGAGAAAVSWETSISCDADGLAGTVPVGAGGAGLARPAMKGCLTPARRGGGPAVPVLGSWVGGPLP